MTSIRAFLACAVVAAAVLLGWFAPAGLLVLVGVLAAALVAFVFTEIDLLLGPWGAVGGKAQEDEEL